MVLSQSVAKPYYKEQGKLYEGQKRYELSNHLGNVLAVINDRKKMTTRGLINTYDATVISAQDYFPFGLEMGSDREVNNSESGYRYGFNGKEKDQDGEFGSNTHYDYGFRIYNPAIAKFLSVDPLSPQYPWYTPYQFAGNTPIQAIDLDGLEQLYSTEGKYMGQGLDLMSNDIHVGGVLTTLHNLLKLQASNEISDAHKLRAVARNQSLDKMFSGEVFFTSGTDFTGTKRNTEDEIEYGEISFVSLKIDRVVESKSQKALDQFILTLGHEYLHIYQQFTGMDTDETQPAREVMAHHFNLFPNKTKVLNGTDFNVGVTNVFNANEEYYEGIMAHQALGYINQLSDNEKEKYGSLIEDINNKIVELEGKGYVFPEAKGGVNNNFSNFNKANEEKRKEVTKK